MNGRISKAEAGVFKTISDSLKTFHIMESKWTKHASDQLTLMNIPFLLARRDAAYDVAIETILEKRGSKSSGEMLLAYKEAGKLLRLAKKTNNDIESALNRMERRRPTESVGAYFHMMVKLVSSALSLVKCESVICTNTHEITSIFGESQEFEPENMLRSFSEVESKLRAKFILLVAAAEPNLAKERAKNRKVLSGADRARYDEALAILKESFRR